MTTIIGNISKKDLSDAESSYDKDPLHSCIIGFNASPTQDLKQNEKVKIICNNVIYKLIEDFEKWESETRKMLEAKEIQFLQKPCKVILLKGYVFRQNNPAIAGVEVLLGTLETGIQLMKRDGVPLTEVKGLQKEQENLSKAEKGMQIAVSMPNVTIGRQLLEGDTLYSFVNEENFRKFKEFKKYLSPDEIEVLKEIAEIMRKNNPVWGI